MIFSLYSYIIFLAIKLNSGLISCLGAEQKEELRRRQQELERKEREIQERMEKLEQMQAQALQEAAAATAAKCVQLMSQTLHDELSMSYFRAERSFLRRNSCSTRVWTRRLLARASACRLWVRAEAVRGRATVARRT